MPRKNAVRRMFKDSSVWACPTGTGLSRTGCLVHIDAQKKGRYQILSRNEHGWNRKKPLKYAPCQFGTRRALSCHIVRLKWTVSGKGADHSLWMRRLFYFADWLTQSKRRYDKKLLWTVTIQGSRFKVKISLLEPRTPSKITRILWPSPIIMM